MSSGSTFHRWSELPAEIELKVLSTELLLENLITWPVHDTHTHQVLLPLALANKHLHILATEMYYGENTVALRLSPYNQNTHGQVRDGHRYKVFRYPNPRIAHGVRKLQLHIDTSWGWISEEAGLFHKRDLVFLF